MDADVLALMEIENSAAITYLAGQPRDKALADLVAALNQAAGGTRWAFAPSPVVTGPNEDVIRTAFGSAEGLVDLRGLCRQSSGWFHDEFELDRGEFPEPALTAFPVVLPLDPGHDRQP